MGMLRTCAAPGCESLTLGELCVAHEEMRAPAVWPRGRPFATDIAPRELEPALADVAAHAHESSVRERVRAGR